MPRGFHPSSATRDHLGTYLLLDGGRSGQEPLLSTSLGPELVGQTILPTSLEAEGVGDGTPPWEQPLAGGPQDLRKAPFSRFN